MATGICYTQSGTEKRYEDEVSISLVKGTHDIPTIKNDVLSVANENHYSFEVSSSYIFSNKGSKRDDCPLIFVTYYPSSGKNPCYFNFGYNNHKITFFLYLLTPNTVGYNVFNKMKYTINGADKTVDLDANSKFEIYVNDSAEIIFHSDNYTSWYNIRNITRSKNYYVDPFGLSGNKTAQLLYYNSSDDVKNDMFTLYHKINGVSYTNMNYHHDITISNITEDSIAYMYVVPHYIYVHPWHAGYSQKGESDRTDNVWDDTEDSPNDNYTQYKMSCSGRSSNTGGNYDRGPWDAPAGDGGNRTNFRDVVYPVGVVRHSDNNGAKEKWHNYHLGVKLTTSLYEYNSSLFYTVYRSTYTDRNNLKYFSYNNVCDNFLSTLNNSPKPTSSYWGDAEITQRYIEPYNTYVLDGNSKRGNYKTVTYAKQFPQNNTYIALDRSNPDNSAREAATTMPPQFWMGPKMDAWGEFTGAPLDNFKFSYVAPPMILQGLICGGSGGDRNQEALGLFSAISLKGKNKNPNKLMFHADVYNTYFDPNISQSDIGTINQPYNSYIITGRIKNGGRSGSELPIWQKFRFNVWNNIDKWIEEYG